MLLDGTVGERGGGIGRKKMGDGGRCSFCESHSLSPSSLICSATYTVHSSGEELFLRKFFKFNVSPNIS